MVARVPPTVAVAPPTVTAAAAFFLVLRWTALRTSPLESAAL